VIWGWAAAQYPYLLPQTLEVEDAAAPDPILAAVLIVFGIAVIVVLPALGLLYALSQRSMLDEEAEPDRPGERV
jgi:cytochrome d ubiquinol oxidase subunit II